MVGYYVQTRDKRGIWSCSKLCAGYLNGCAGCFGLLPKFESKGFYYLGSDLAGPLTYGAHLTRTYTAGTVSYPVYNRFIGN